MSGTSSAVDPSFDAATHLRAHDNRSTFYVDIHSGWTVGDKPNGGYLLALLGRAATEAVATTGTPLDVISATVTYLAVPTLGAAEIRTTILRQGRTTHHVRSALVQDERTLVDAVCVVGSVAPARPPRYNDIDPLEIPPPEGCIRLLSPMPDGVPVGILETTDLRLDPATLPFAPRPAGEIAQTAELRGWTRFADGREVDPGALLYFVDAIPPATLLIGSTGWVPTLTMSVYVRARPAPGWLGIRLIAHHVAGDTVDESCTLWDSDGHVVAQATQLARVRFPHEWQ